MARGDPARASQEEGLAVTLLSAAALLHNSDGLISEAVLGEISVPGWLRIVTPEVSRLGISHRYQFALHVDVLPAHFPPGKVWKKSLNWAVSERISGDKFGVSDPTPLILQAYERMARQLAPSLFELDPRIGESFADDPPPEECPLFDPISPLARFPYPHKIYRDISEWCLEYGKARKDYHLIPSVSSFPPCVFCSESVILHEYPDEIVWGGGNIGCVHQICAPWINEGR